MRIERDSLGELEVEENALYGAQTQRAINNFPISGLRMPESFIKALLIAKRSAAIANSKLGLLPADMATAIVKATDDLLDQGAVLEHFPVDVFQTGSGTSTNMNANEVLARLASENYGQTVHPNDHINYGQSSNDVIPSSLHISAALEIHNQLIPALRHFVSVTNKKAVDVDSHIKTGRTHLMDAMPVRLSQSLHAWSAQIEQNIDQLQAFMPHLLAIAQGGTAVGTGINADPEFADEFTKALSNYTQLPFTAAKNFFTRIGSQDTAVALSGLLKTTAVSIMKISNDLRWMNSGPLAGLGEIELQALQPGSSIMPGKVNPVIPEATAMVAAQVIGNDSTVTVAGQSGNFELNVMLPLVAHNLLESIKLLSNACPLLADKAIATFTVRGGKLQEALARNPILVTALNPFIGYSKAAEIAKKAYASDRPIVDVAEEETDIPRKKLIELMNPEHLTGNR